MAMLALSMVSLVVVRSVLHSMLLSVPTITRLFLAAGITGTAAGAAAGVWAADRAGSALSVGTLAAGGAGALAVWVVFSIFGSAGATAGQIVQGLTLGFVGAAAGSGFAAWRLSKGRWAEGQ